MIRLIISFSIDFLFTQERRFLIYCSFKETQIFRVAGGIVGG